jgi:hypothetical protein
MSTLIDSTVHTRLLATASDEELRRLSSDEDDPQTARLARNEMALRRLLERLRRGGVTDAQLATVRLQHEVHGEDLLGVSVDEHGLRVEVLTLAGRVVQRIAADGRWRTA